MRSLDAILDELRARPDCAFGVAAGLPSLPAGLGLPADLVGFHVRFRAARLFGRRFPRYRILPPDEFVQVGVAVYGEPMARSPQRSWFALADVGDGNYIAIDCAPGRLGYCYDVFHETVGQAGSCKVIARSFTEFMSRVAGAGDQAWWLGDRFETYGYADKLGDPAAE